jgi:N-acetyl-gamma-glutamyl-phosphate reductase
MGRPVAVLGASGYAGGELVRLLDAHPEFEPVHLGAHSHAGARLGEVHPHLEGGDRVLGSNHPDDLPEVEVVFLALPHGASAEVGHSLAERGAVVVDLGADFRLDTPERYREAYGADHPLPDQLPRWVYGLPELFDLAGVTRIASPGCYPTAVLLAVAPLLRAGLVGPGPIVADCLSGVSGAGRVVREDLTFGAVAEGVRAYAVATHRHRPEIEMALDALLGGTHRVTFTPHLVPMQRGLAATVTAPAADGLTTEQARRALTDAYQGRGFVEVIDRPPQTRWVVSSNKALVTAAVDTHSGMVIAQSAIDNLVKGAAGQAVQAANIAVGLAEDTGLPHHGWMP